MTDSAFPSFREALIRHMDENAEDITKLASRANVSRDALYKISHGKTRTPNLELGIKVARAYGKSVEEFMGLSADTISPQIMDRVLRLSPSEQEVLSASLDVLFAKSSRPTKAE